jgi:hypothetical protein
MSGVKRGLRASVVLACLLAGQRALAPMVANATYLPYTAILDDPTGAQGFGTAALSNGHLNIQKIAGMVFGAGQTAAVQSANGTLLQKAFTYCDTAGVECDEPDVLAVEFNLPNGLSVPASPNGWKGRFNKRFDLRQAAINAPCLVIGDPTGANPKGDVDWDGAECNYINDQTGQQSSVTLLEGSLLFSRISNLTGSSETLANGQAVHPGWDCHDRGSRTGNGFSFQNTHSKILCSGAQASLFRNNFNGTGNISEDMYYHNGGSISGAGLLSDAGIYWGGNGRSDDVCIRCNYEHFYANTPISFQTDANTTLIGTHIEDVGTPYTLFSFTGSQVRLIGTKILNFRGITATATPVSANNVQLFRVNYGAQVDVDDLALQWDGSAPFTSTGSALFAGTPGTEGLDADVAFRLHTFTLSDVSGATNSQNMVLEPALPTPLSILQKFGTYTYDRLQPSTVGAEFSIVSSFTLYGAHEHAKVLIPNNLSAVSTVTLANTRMPSGTVGSSLAVPAGAWMEIDRTGSGTAANPTTVNNGAGTAIGTITAQGYTLYGSNGSQFGAVQ